MNRQLRVGLIGVGTGRSRAVVLQLTTVFLAVLVAAAPSFGGTANDGDVLFTDVGAAAGDGFVGAIDPDTGAINVITSNAIDAGLPALDGANGVIGLPDGRIVFFDALTDNLFRVDDPSTGVRTLLSAEGGFVGVDLSYDSNGNILYADPGPVADSGQVVRVDPDTGVETVVASNAVGAGADVIDAVNDVVGLPDGRILFIDELSDFLIRVDDPATGNRTTLATSFTGNSLSLASDGSVLFTDAGSAAGEGSVSKVDPDTGVITLVSSNAMGGGADLIDGADDVAGLAGDRLVFVDRITDVLFRVDDPSNGDRVTIASSFTGNSLTRYFGGSSDEACCMTDGSCTDEPADTCTATGGTPQGAGTDCATDGCTTVTLSILNAAADEATGTVTLTLMLDASLPQPIEIDVTTADGSAAAPGDYLALSSETFVILAGETSMSVPVTVNDDSIVEANETFMASLSGLVDPTGRVVLITAASAIGTIDNDDMASLSVVDVSVPEGSGGGTTNFDFVVTLDNAVQGGISQQFDVIDGTATDADDFDVDTSNPLLFAGTSGETQTIRIVVDADDKVEASEQFTIQFGAIAGLVGGIDMADLSSPAGAATGTIQNDDNATLTIVDVIQSEGTVGTTNFDFTVTLDSAVQGGLAVNFTVGDDTATDVDDFDVETASPLSFAGAAGEMQTIRVIVDADSKVEADESYTVTLDSVTVGNFSFVGSPATGTIQNDDTSTVTLAGVSATQVEGSGGTTTEYDFSMTLGNAVQGGFTAEYVTNDGTAKTGEGDYQDNDGSMSFEGTAGESKTITVLVNHDAVVEADELFEVLLNNLVASPGGVPGVTIVGSPQTGTIQNDDTATLTLAGVTATQNEGTGGTTTDFDFSVTLSGDVQGGFDVAYTTNDDTATTADGDYEDNDDSRTFVGFDGESALIRVQVNHDPKVEADELFEVALGALSNLGGVDAGDIAISGSPQAGMINNDDTASLTVVDVTTNEGTGGTTDFDFVVTLDNPVQGGFSQQFDVIDGSATDADDWDQITANPLAFTGTTGETQTIRIRVTADSKVEQDEAFSIQFGAITGLGADIDPADVSSPAAPATGNVLNDDSATLTIEGVLKKEGTGGGTTNFEFDVTLDNAVQGGLNLGFVVNDGTATDVDDFNVNTHVPLFFAGSMGEVVTIVIGVDADNKVEGDEQFEVALTAITNLVGIDPADVTTAGSPATGEILNDDSTTVTMSIPDAQLLEGSSGGVTPFAVSAVLSNPVQGGFDLAYTTNDGDATTADLDYQDNDGFLGFSGTEGESLEIIVNAIHDITVELNESFNVAFGAISNLAAGIDASDISFNGTPLALTIENDDSAILSIGEVMDDEENGPFTIPVMLSAPVDVDILVDISTVEDSATGGGVDYEDIVSETLTFPMKTTANQTVMVTIVDDNIVEFAEVFNGMLDNLVNQGRAVSIVNPFTTATATILNNAAIDNSRISIADLPQNEEDTSFDFVMTLTNPVATDVTVERTTAPGAALGGGVDYQDETSTITTIPANATSAFANVTVVDDNIVELNEMFTITLANIESSGLPVMFDDDLAEGMILNTDKATISVNSPSAPEASGALDFTVSLTSPVDVAISVDFSTVVGGTASAGTDYTTITGQQVDFPANSTADQMVTVTVIDETLVELDETINVLLDNEQVSGRIVNVSPNGVGTIQNDDQAVIAITNVTDDEGDSGTTKFDFMVSMSNDVDVDVTMDFETRAATATVADDDYSQAIGIVTFPAAPAPANQLIRVFVQGDTSYEPTEEFFIDLHGLNAMGRDVVFGDPVGRGRILNDDILINGACCFPDSGACLDMIPLDCVVAGGQFQGTTTYCWQITCPQPVTGACCFFNGQCFSSSEFDCSSNGGFYQGDGVACGPALCVPGDTANRGGGTDKGSLLFIHAVEVRWEAAAPHSLIQDTFVSLTNDYPEDVNVQMYFINGDPPADPVLDPNSGEVTERAHTGWNWVNNGITLTGNEATYWSVLTGDPKGVSPFVVLDPGDPPGRPAPDGSGERVLRGYIIAWAVDNIRHEIRWNHLSAAATTVRYDTSTAWEYGATTFAVVEGAAMHGEVTGTPGLLKMDGSEYTASYSQLLMNFQAADSNGFSPEAPSPFTVMSDGDLTLHPVSADLRQTNDGPVTTQASFEVWNENETKFSGMYRCVTCWDQTVISQYDSPNHFMKMFLQTEHGKTRIDGIRDDACDIPVTGVYSREAAILGVAVRLLSIDGGGGSKAAAGGNLFGMGFQPALIQVSVPADPPDEAGEDESGRPSLPLDPTEEEIKQFLGDFVESMGGNDTDGDGAQMDGG